ncbi:hypothetical protein [Thalassotalea agarivorans]|nr:hypothetical protein [Thalassotalea agarivorans]
MAKNFRRQAIANKRKRMVHQRRKKVVERRHVFYRQVIEDLKAS